jgi:hypothetical protein
MSYIFMLFLTSCSFNPSLWTIRRSFLKFSDFDVPQEVTVKISCLSGSDVKNETSSLRRNKYYFLIEFNNATDVDVWAMKNDFNITSISTDAVAMIQHPEPEDRTLRQGCGWNLPTDSKPAPFVYKKDASGRLLHIVAFKFENQLWGFSHATY